MSPKRLLPASYGRQSPRPKHAPPAFWTYAEAQAQRADDIGELVRAVTAHPRRTAPLGQQAFRVFQLQWFPKLGFASCALRDEFLRDQRRQKRRAAAAPQEAPPRPRAAAPPCPVWARSC